jgi:tRNA A37 threonylcarbamoyladenosine synthetase subunit TsaC/SUA5/YrdC
MTTLTIEIPEKVEKTLCDLIEQLGGKIVATGVNKPTAKAAKKKQILDDLEESVKWVKLYQEGKVQSKSIEELLDEL